jgi:hypothetical protein
MSSASLARKCVILLCCVVVIALKLSEVEMAVVFAIKVVDIPMGKGRKELPSSVRFERNVRDAVVALNGFRLNFSDKDHPINVCEVFVEKSSVTEGTTVNFSVHCNFADKNSNAPYSGWVAAIIIADVA